MSGFCHLRLQGPVGLASRRARGYPLLFGMQRVICVRREPCARRHPAAAGDIGVTRF